MTLGGIIGLYALTLIPTWIIFTIRKNRREEATAELDRQVELTAEERLEDCLYAALIFKDKFGTLATQACSRQELRETIEKVGRADVLTQFLAVKVGELPGLTIGKHFFANSIPVPVKIPESLRTRHVYMVGKSGTGKTTLIANMIRQDLEAGHGIAVIAPEQEMILEEILPFIPASRYDDIIYVNPADTEAPVPFNPLAIEEGEDLDLKADEILTVLHRLMGEHGASPRMDAILRHTIYALLQVPGSTFLDIPKILEDDEYRAKVLARLTDETDLHFWTHTYPAYPKDAHLPIVNRISRFLRPKPVRSILCTPGKSLSIRKAMDEGKIVLFNLSDGILGEMNAQLLGQLVVAKLQLAAMSRADTPKERRRPFHVYIDEFQSFCGVAGTSYEKILSRARKYGLGLVLAHQQTGQIPDSLLKEILGNVSTMISFNVGATDARRVANEMVGQQLGEAVPLDHTKLLHLDCGQAFCRIERTILKIRTPKPLAAEPSFDLEGLLARVRAPYVPAEKPAPESHPIPTSPGKPTPAHKLPAPSPEEAPKPVPETQPAALEDINPEETV